MPSENDLIDLRSDTVTRPCARMREAMASAPVGDDVYGDDPTVIRLQETAAQMLGKDAALFLPSGTQSNLAAVMAHCDRGHEYLIGDQYHVFRHEAMGSAVLGSVAAYPLSTQADGSLNAADIAAAVKPDDAHYPVSQLLCLENTVSGKALTLDQLQGPSDTARLHGLHVHLDGARFFNAAVALNIDPAEMAAAADTVSLCLSKGLGAPVGSVLVGNAQTIARAHRVRKMLGGGMRQAGVIAAAGLYALEHNIQRLAQDHERARYLGEALDELNALWVNPVQVATNMVFISPTATVAERMFEHLHRAGVLIGRPAASVRLVLHKDINDSMLEHTISAFKALAD